MSKSDTEWPQNFIGCGTQSGSETLVKQAIEYLKIAHEKVQSAELGRNAAEAELGRYRDEVKNDVNTKLLEVEVRMEAVISRLAAAEQRATAAEQRANKAEAMVRRLEDERQTKVETGDYLMRVAA